MDGEVVPGVKVIRGSKQQGGPPGHTLAWSLSAGELVRLWQSRE